jgi:hypothetical protein
LISDDLTFTVFSSNNMSMVVEKVKTGVKSMYSDIEILFLAVRSDIIGFTGIQYDGILEFWNVGMLGLAEPDLILAIFLFHPSFCFLSLEERAG